MQANEKEEEVEEEMFTLLFHWWKYVLRLALKRISLCGAKSFYFGIYFK